MKVRRHITHPQLQHSRKTSSVTDFGLSDANAFKTLTEISKITVSGDSPKITFRSQGRVLRTISKQAVYFFCAPIVADATLAQLLRLRYYSWPGESSAQRVIWKYDLAV